MTFRSRVTYIGPAVLLRNLAAICMMWLALDHLTATRSVNAQATQSCQQVYDNCAGPVGNTKETCDAGCNGDQACLDTCQNHYSDGIGECVAQYNQCVATQTQSCQQAANGTCGTNNAPYGVTYNPQTGSCSFICTCNPSGRPSYCPGGPNAASCGTNGWVCNSPVLIDTAGDGFNLTSADEGVRFNLSGRGLMSQWAWTRQGDDDAWLALDRNGDGVIDTGVELFGSVSPQPAAPAGILPNGFRSLATLDSPSAGGNDDGIVDVGDAAFARLRLWRDVNHNGISEPDELLTLPSLGVGRLDLAYQERQRRDQHGNTFLYRARVWDAHGRQNKWAWDVFLTTGG